LAFPQKNKRSIQEQSHTSLAPRQGQAGLPQGTEGPEQATVAPTETQITSDSRGGQSGRKKNNSHNSFVKKHR
jgi:hypothetical protein